MNGFELPVFKQGEQLATFRYTPMDKLKSPGISIPWAFLLRDSHKIKEGMIAWV